MLLSVGMKRQAISSSRPRFRVDVFVWRHRIEWPESLVHIPM